MLHLLAKNTKYNKSVNIDNVFLSELLTLIFKKMNIFQLISLANII